VGPALANGDQIIATQRSNFYRRFLAKRLNARAMPSPPLVTSSDAINAAQINFSSFDCISAPACFSNEIQIRNEQDHLVEEKMATNPVGAQTAFPTDTQILGYSRWVIFVAAFFAMAVISPYEYAWSSMSGHIGGLYHWSHTQIGWMFTLFVIFESVGTLPGGILRDKFGPRWVTVVAGVIAGVGIWATSFGPNYTFVLILWCIGSFFAGFIYNTCVTTANKWFPDKPGVVAGLIAGAFSWGALPFIFPIRAIPKAAPDATFFHVIYVMAVIIGAVAIVAALFMKDPHTGWRPANWAPTKEVKRPTDHQYSLAEALSTWQMWLLIISFVLISSAGLAGVSKIIKYSNSFHFTAAGRPGRPAASLSSTVLAVSCWEACPSGSAVKTQ
jgi:MFS family permease